jgi:hypothetical protein
MAAHETTASSEQYTPLSSAHKSASQLSTVFLVIFWVMALPTLQLCRHFAVTCCNCSLKVYAACSSATMVTICQDIPCHNPQDHNVNLRCQERLIILYDFRFFSAKYVKPCSRNDPKLNECAKRHAKDVISYAGLAQGKLQGAKKQCHASDVPRQDSKLDP